MPDSPSFAAPSPAEPSPAFWADPASYDAVLRDRYLTPLRDASATGCPLSLPQQIALLGSLHWYFTTDRRERAPTVVVTPAMAEVFHARLREIMAYLTPEAIAALDADVVPREVQHALLSYRDPAYRTAIGFDGFDHARQLVRLTYTFHGDAPTEAFLGDGRPLTPSYAKTRACRFFGRTLFRQRQLWLPVDGVRTLTARLDGHPIPLVAGEPEFAPGAPQRGDSAVAVQAIQRACPPGKGQRVALPGGATGLKIRLLRWMSRLPGIRTKYRDAWIFLDRWDDADDNAEHLYRWVRRHHPEINAWFLLDRNAKDWSRLAAEGFRLMPPGLGRKLLTLNSKVIVSSHAEYMLGGFDPRYYGDLMHWHAVFVPHGISKDDVSHWLNGLPIDLILSTSPGEFASYVDDDTPYIFTHKDCALTGFPRQDALLAARSTPPDSILVMPTWRASLVDGRAAQHSADAAVANSTYVGRWRAFLNNPRLHALAQRSGLQLVFFVHPNAAPYLHHFNIPASITLRSKQDAAVLPLLQHAAALITDYTSVAFEMANLRRPTFYYQFDRAEFYGGAHNWRPGYFDYDRDGFGPVSTEEDDLIAQLEAFVNNGAQAAPATLTRMAQALPLNDGHACQRVFDAIVKLDPDLQRSTRA